MFRILAVPALAHAFDVDLHNFDESSDALSLLQLRAASDAQHSAFPLGRDNPVAGADKDAQMARNYEYPVPAGWRIGYGMGNRTHPTVSPGGYVGQMNAYITHKYVDLNVRTMEQCVAEVQRNDDRCLGANGVTWGMELMDWNPVNGIKFAKSTSGKCLCDWCWNPIPQDWTTNPIPPHSWHSVQSDGAEGWLTAGPGTLDPSKYSEKRKAAIIARYNSGHCGNLENFDPLLGVIGTTTTTTTTQATVEDGAAAVGRSKFDFDFIIHGALSSACMLILMYEGEWLQAS